MIGYTLSKRGVRLYQKTHYWVYKTALSICGILISLLAYNMINLSNEVNAYESKIQSLQIEVISNRLHNEYVSSVDYEHTDRKDDTTYSVETKIQELGYASLKSVYDKVKSDNDPNITSPQAMVDAINNSLQNNLWKKFETNINSVTGLTAEQLNNAIDRYLDRSGNHANSILHGAGDALVRAEEKYHVNAIHILGIIGYESGHATSKNSKELNNIAGIFDGRSSEQKAFDSVDQCIDYLARLIRQEYIDKGREKIGDIAPKYLNGEPDKSASSENWAYNVTEISHDYLRTVNFMGDF